MVYLAIAVVLILIIAPIFAILPSKRQKEQMALRRIAMSEGLSVELTRIEDPDPDPQKYLSNTGKPLERVMAVIAYRYARRRPANWRQVARVDWCLVRRQGAGGEGLPPNWTWEAGTTDRLSSAMRSFIGDNLAKLPNDVVRVEEINYVISVYWNEQGGTEAVNAIIGFVKDCALVTPFSADSADLSE